MAPARKPLASKFWSHVDKNGPLVSPELGTHSENTLDMVAKGRRKEYDRRGERNPRAVLTWDSVRQIRELRSSDRTVASLAKQFGVSRGAIHRVVTGESWSTSEAA